MLGIILRRHDLLCGLLVGELSKLKGHAATADAQLTVLANWVEDQVGGGGSDSRQRAHRYSALCTRQQAPAAGRILRWCQPAVIGQSPQGSTAAHHTHTPHLLSHCAVLLLCWCCPDWAGRTCCAHILPVCCSLCLCARVQLRHGVWPGILLEPLQRIVQAARLAASLQPDGTGLPEVRVRGVCRHLCLLVAERL